MTTEHLPQPIPRPEPGNLVAAIERVERAVASATELPALTEVHACISALEHLSKTMNLAREQLNRLAESRIRAERKLGQLLKDSVARGGHGAKSDRAASSLGGSSRPLPPGVSKKQSSRWQHLAAIPDAPFEEFFAVAWKEGAAISAEGLWRFLRSKEPRKPPPTRPGDDVSWLLDHARRVLPAHVELTTAVGNAMPTALRATKPDALAAWLLDARRSSCADAWMKALQRHLAAGDDHQAIVALHVRALCHAAASSAICVPKPAPGDECVVAYFGKRLRAFALVFREVGTLLAPMEIA